MLNINNLIILPEEPGDETGHINGMVRFVKGKTVIVGSYPESWSKDKRFMDFIAEKHKKELGDVYRIIRVPNGIPPGEKSEGIASAVGNHINFLRFGNRLFLSCYGIPEDGPTKEVLQKALPNIEVISIDIPSIKNLLQEAGF